MERCYLKSYRLPWSKWYPPAKLDTVQITHTEFCTVFSGKLLFLRSLSGIPSLSCMSKLLCIGTFENFKCSTMLSGQWRSWSQSPILKLPSRTFSLELCTWTVQRLGYWFLFRSPFSLLVLFNILTEFQTQQPGQQKIPARILCCSFDFFRPHPSCVLVNTTRRGAVLEDFLKGRSNFTVI